jgi:hypothetical protein
MGFAAGVRETHQGNALSNQRKHEHSVEFEGVVGSKFDRNVTIFAPHQALKIVA